MSSKLLQLSKLLKLTKDNISTTSVLVNQIYEQYFSHKINDECNNSKKSNGSCAQNLHNFDDTRTNQANLITATNDDVWIIPTQGSQKATSTTTTNDVWIFGYGSLVWKADFPYIDRRRGYICGYQRRFYQHSIDHRGTLEKPGRVVTLLPTNSEADRVYGVAYRIAAQQKQEVLQHLDYREKNGYERCTLQFHEFPEAGHFDVIMYVATHVNDSYAGAVWQVQRIAEQIFTSAGPSGPNRDYLFNLANAMRELFPGVVDEHLCELESAVLALVDSKEHEWLEEALKSEILAAIEVDIDEKNDADVEQVVQRIKTLTEYSGKPGWREALLTKQLQLDESKS